MDIEARKQGCHSVRSTASKDQWTSEVASISVCASPRASESCIAYTSASSLSRLQAVITSLRRALCRLLQEDAMLENLVGLHGTKKWVWIAYILQKRTSKQVCLFLCCSICRPSWQMTIHPASDLQLMLIKFACLQCRRRWKSMQDAELKVSGTWSPEVCRPSELVFFGSRTCHLLCFTPP